MPGSRPALGELLGALPSARLVRGDPAARVAGVGYDSRRLRPGELFVAVPGLRHNGLQFVSEALARGAAAIVAEADPAEGPGTSSGSAPLVLVPSARAALADLAATFYEHPSRRLAVVGVTGTDGKTTTAHLLGAILEAHGLRTGWLTTVGTKIGDVVRPNATDHTTPEAPIVQGTLAEMATAGVEGAILETSSHALALDRVRNVEFRVGVFTNLSPEHIDFHHSFQAYRATKGELFEGLPAEGLAVLNADDPSGAFMRQRTRARTISFGLNAQADVRATDVVLSAEGSSFTLVVSPTDRSAGLDLAEGVGAEGASVGVRTRLVGQFNVANWLAAYAAATYFGATPDDVRRAAERQAPVTGRMHFVQGGQPFLVVVDFAHTPQALESALAAARRLTRGRVLLLFGLPGGRDARNRPTMGWLAARRSDFFAITTDDPFDEDPARIARQIAEGAGWAGAAEGQEFVVELDRRAALRTLLGRAEPGDVVLMAGHGHLNTLVIGERKLPWNDADVAAEELRALGYGT